MGENTKINPGCYHSMLSHLSAMSGISIRKEIEFDSVDKIRRKVKRKGSTKTKLEYPARDVTIVGSDGIKYPYMSNNQRFDVYKPNLQVAKVIVWINRSSNEFGIEIIPAGNYRDSLVGGWYSDIKLFEIAGQYFAPNIECGHS